MLNHYNEILSRQSDKAVRSILQASAMYAASQSIVFLCAALAFWYGGNLISSGEYTMFQLFICFASLISGAQIAGAIFSHAPGISRAIDAAGGHLPTEREQLSQSDLACWPGTHAGLGDYLGEPGPGFAGQCLRGGDYSGL